MIQTQPTDPLNIHSPLAPLSVFGDATEAIEYELTELITDIHLAGDYTGEEAIVHAIGLTARCNQLQSYLFCHLDELIRTKKMAHYEGIYPHTQD
jgi:hypothetical protein